MVDMTFSLEAFLIICGGGGWGIRILCGDLRREITTAVGSVNTNFDARSCLLLLN
jgi:hypothetical protein